MKSKIKYVLLDVDGCIVTQKGKKFGDIEVIPGLKEVIERKKNIGIQFGFITGRNKLELTKEAKLLGLNGFSVYDNGATVYNSKGKLIHRKFLNEMELNTIFSSLIESHSPLMIAYSEGHGSIIYSRYEDLIEYVDHARYKKFDDFEEWKEHVRSNNRICQLIFHGILTIFTGEIPFTTSLGNTWSNFTAWKTTKYKGYKYALKESAIPSDECLVVCDGDNNDLNLIQNMPSKGSQLVIVGNRWKNLDPLNKGLVEWIQGPFHVVEALEKFL